MKSDFISIVWGIIFSIILVCGIVHGCGSCSSHLDETRDKELPVPYRTLISDLRKDFQYRSLIKYKSTREKELSDQFQTLLKDFNNDTFQFEMEDLKSNDPYSYSPTDILLQPNWRSVWSNWNAKRCKKLEAGYDLLNKYIYRLHSVTNPPEYALRYSSMILDDFSWKLECEEKKISMLKKLFAIYEANNSKWFVQNGKIVYLDDSFRNNIDVMNIKYYLMCHRLKKSQKEDL